MSHTKSFQIVIVGAGSAGIAVASSLLKRKHDLNIALIDPAASHYYQPGFTLVGAGVFNLEQVRRDMKTLIPKGVTWLQQAVQSFNPQSSEVTLDNGDTVAYERLIVCPGLKLDWDGVEGLSEALGKNGVTSNYRSNLAPYTWDLVRGLKSGKAIFTQPPMPIKCAGAPQKALYLSADYWQRNGHLANIELSFYNAGGVLFGVKEYVPALESYIARYRASLMFNHKLVKVDGEARRAWFLKTDADGNSSTVETDFDMLHVCPPQTAPDFIRSSPLVDAGGWVDVDPFSLRHKQYSNIWGLGDVVNTSNAKTAAAVRQQAPVVAANIVAEIANRPDRYAYDGYGSCPLTVENGRIVLAEFIYGGKLKPTFPKWLLDGERATRMAWILKKDMLPTIYWHGMLKGREWLAAPARSPQ